MNHKNAFEDILHFKKNFTLFLQANELLGWTEVTHPITFSAKFFLIPVLEWLNSYTDLFLLEANKPFACRETNNWNIMSQKGITVVYNKIIH